MGPLETRLHRDIVSPCSNNNNGKQNNMEEDLAEESIQNVERRYQISLTSIKWIFGIWNRRAFWHGSKQSVKAIEDIENDGRAEHVVSFDR